MTTKPDFDAIIDLKDRYQPAQRGILNADETDLIYKALEIKTRNNIELQNIRNATVVLYGQFADNTDDTKQLMALMDAMSGICAVIDQEKFKRGMPV